LTLYWIQMVGCSVEMFLRNGYHAVACILALPFYLLAVGYLRRRKLWVATLPAEENLRKAVKIYGKDSQYHWPLLPIEQLSHHQLWFLMFFNYFPSLIWHNLANPGRPFFADGQDVSIYRPKKPKIPQRIVATTFGDCCHEICGVLCNSCCKACCSVCDHCCEMVFTLGIRYFRSSFVCLSGYRALQCGALCGPCVRGCCYDPCVGGKTEQGLCRMCEVDEIRSRRWIREAHGEKMQRTATFFDAHPELMRPDPEYFDVGRGSAESLMARLLLEECSPPQEQMLKPG